MKICNAKQRNIVIHPGNIAVHVEDGQQLMPMSAEPQECEPVNPSAEECSLAGALVDELDNSAHRALAACENLYSPSENTCTYEMMNENADEEHIYAQVIHLQTQP